MNKQEIISNLYAFMHQDRWVGRLGKTYLFRTSCIRCHREKFNEMDIL